MKVIRWVVGLVCLSFAPLPMVLVPLVGSGTALAAKGSGDPLMDRVHSANDRFKDVSVATAEGYSPIPCADGADGGSMGIHYVNPKYLQDDTIHIAHPGAVLYEPQPDGSLALVAVEYITFTGPASLEGHLFNFVDKPNRFGLDPFYEMHVWAWRTNPAGTYADMNMNVSCHAVPLDRKS